jgi:alpha-beta hydrolase superfamily lysophospholipase
MRRSLLLVLLAAVLAVPAATAREAQRAHECVRGAELWFRAADGVRLAGHRFGGLRPGRKSVVVLAHQSNGSLCEWSATARRLAARGVWVFAFDFRGHGLSKGRQHYGRLAVDLAAAVKTARGLGARNVVIAGASLGGIAAVVAGASIRPAVAGLAALSAPAAIAGRIDALPFAPRLAVPALYVAARDDQNEPYDFAADAQRLFDATGSAQKRVELVPGSLHGVALVEGSASVRALLEAFIRDPRAAVRT